MIQGASRLRIHTDLQVALRFVGLVTLLGLRLRSDPILGTLDIGSRGDVFAQVTAPGEN
jgi:hypothetical protein